MLHIMNFLRAVRGPITRGSKIYKIQSEADLELERKITRSEFDGLLQRYSLDELYHNIEKVNMRAQWQS